MMMMTLTVSLLLEFPGFAYVDYVIRPHICDFLHLIFYILLSDWYFCCIISSAFSLLSLKPFPSGCQNVSSCANGLPHCHTIRYWFAIKNWQRTANLSTEKLKKLMTRSKMKTDDHQYSNPIICPITCDGKVKLKIYEIENWQELKRTRKRK